MRIAIVLASLELGGAERQALSIAEHLQTRRGARVTVFGMGEPGRVVPMLDRLTIPWRVLPRVESRFAAVSWWRCRKVAEILAAHRPEALLAFTNPANVASGLARRRCAARACIWYQLDEGLARFAPWLERAAARGCTDLLANSRGGAAALSRALGISEDRVRLVRNGVSLPPARDGREAWRRRLGAGEGDVVACMLANLHHAKDHRTLIEAWREVRHRIAPRRALLVLAGRFDQAHAGLRELVERLGLGGDIVMPGAVEDVAGLIGAIDLGVFSSRSEGCPNAVLECMSVGLAVAATDIPGVREALGDGAAPYLAPPGDASALAAAVVSLILDDQARQRQGTANRERCASEFGVAAMFEGIERALAPRGGMTTAAGCVGT